MHHAIQLAVLIHSTFFTGGSIFLGLPESNWTTSSQMCSLPGIDKINTNDIFNNSSKYVDLKEVKKAWTGTTSACFCLTDQHEINDDINDCRIECTNAIYTPCSSNQSALVFTFVEDLNIESTKTYIEKECLTTTRDQSKFAVSDCNARHLYGCTHTSTHLRGKSWYEYQEFCLTDGHSVLYNKNIIAEGVNAYTPLWTPIFRSHTVVTVCNSNHDYTQLLHSFKNQSAVGRQTTPADLVAAVVLLMGENAGIMIFYIDRKTYRKRFVSCRVKSGN
ncbi:unnamed protein product [Mytilus coruscus]|uniref:Uncharacterized protein n=1 Tax=Mytilus coruscus TaxID=42192 RepID=A0A6J8DLI2_MYTCO|nr:unnamed protein product [Mytilus coruscus]